jgi:fumarylacetoacetase
VINDTHDPTLRSWVESANSETADFPIQNLPFAVFRPIGHEGAWRIGVGIGDQVADLSRCRSQGLLTGLSDVLLAAIDAPVLNPLMSLGNSAASRLRRRLVEILREGAPRRSDLLLPIREAEFAVPAVIGGYTDFYASIFHATNVGSLFRPESPLLPNYKHVPIAYHGRTSSMLVSGKPFHRPCGQTKRADEQAPAFRPSERLDYEAEIAAFIGVGNEHGTPIRLADAERHLFGLGLLNDWSARDIQAWEYQPLGPFLGKNFATTISPWVVTLEALAPFRCRAFGRPSTDPRPLPYLFAPSNEAEGGFDVTVEVCLRSAAMRDRAIDAIRLSRSSLRDIYWTFGQMMTHHTSNGCNLQPGDIIASGTISGRDDRARGCLLEISRGTDPVELPTGEERLFLADGDEVIFRAFCECAGMVRIGFGECSGLVLPASGGASAG